MLTTIYRTYIQSFTGLSRQVWLLSLLMLINRSGAMVIPFLSVYLTTQLGFSLHETGWVMGAFGLGSLVGVNLGGYLTDKIGYYKVQLFALLFTGMMFFILQHMVTFWSFSITIFILTTISDTFRPANMTAVAAYTEKKNRTRSISLIRLSVNAGWAIGPAIGGFLAIRAGYEWLFWADGGTCIAAAIFLLLVLKPRPLPDDNGKKTAEQKDFSNVFKDRFFLIFIGLNFLTMMVFFQLFTTLPVYYKDFFHLNEDMIGLLIAMNGITIALFEMPLVFIYEKKHKPLRVIVFGAFLIGVAYFLFNFGNWIGLAIISMLFLTFGEIFQMPFSNSFTMTRATPKTLGRYLSFYSMSFALAFIVAPITGMHIADQFGYTVLWNVMTGLGIITTAGYFFLGKFGD